MLFQFPAVVYLANKSLVAYSLFGEFCRIKSDFLLARIDDMRDLQIQHVVKLKLKMFIQWSTFVPSCHIFYVFATRFFAQIDIFPLNKDKNCLCIQSIDMTS